MAILHQVWQNDRLTGESTSVLWEKESDGQVRSIKLDGFAMLYVDKLPTLRKLRCDYALEDEMMGYLPHCTPNLDARAASIDTPLHTLLR